MLTIASVAIAAALGTCSPAGTGVAALPQDSRAEAPHATTSARAEITAVVKPGQRVTVTDDEGRRVEGRIGMLGPDCLSVGSRTGNTDIEYARIVRIDRPHDGLGDGALWGFSAGAIVGFAFVVNEDLSECDPGYFSCGDPHALAYAVVPGIIGGLGAAIGVAADALVRRAPGLYRRGGPADVRFVPTLGRSVAGAMVSVRW